MQQRPKPSLPSGPTAGLLAVALAASLWAVAAVVARRLFDAGVSPIELAQARAVIAALGLALVARSWAPRRAVRRGARARIVALGLAIALVNATYYLAIERLAVAVALVIQYTAPAMVVAWTAFAIKRRPSREVVVALALAIAGVVLVSELVAGEVGRIDGVGITMALASAVLFATYTLLSEDLQVSYGTFGAMFRAFAAASAFWIAFQAPRGVPEALFQRENLPEVLFVGLGGTLAAFILYVWGIGHVRAERAAIAATLEPVVAGTVAYLWLGQALSPVQIFGGALVIAAVVMLQVRRRKVVRAPEP